ncbi:MAG: AI-2E family transporter [Oscillospiraceae bacterium]
MKKTLKGYGLLGLTLFCTAAALLVFYDTVFANKTLLLFLQKLGGALQPIFIGCFIAYLLLPITNSIDGSLRLYARHIGWEGKRPGLLRAVSLALTWLLVCIVGYILVSLILPQVAESVLQLAANMENYYNKVYGWVTRLLEDNPELAAWVQELFQNYYTNLLDWVRETAVPGAQALVAALSGGIWSFVSFATDLVVGVIVSVYLLYSKESWSAGLRRALRALCSEEWEDRLLRATHRADRIFSGFIRGKILDSAIIGLLCLGGCLLLKIPYAPLVSVIVGVTNVIPFFGPFLGAVPSGLLILLADPLKCLTFIVMIVVLQQIDGNILGPRILGGSTGLSSFWVIVAILVGGKFFGLAGMFFGVPVFACLYSLFGTLVRYRLEKKGMSTELEDYGERTLAGDERSAGGAADAPKE